jgi:hypothetical protein
MDHSPTTRHTFLVIIDFTDEALLKYVERALWDAARFIDGVDQTILVQDITGVEGERK